ncbi:MAG: hypothetical protein P8Y45_06515 [Exilibacterium sp.]
MNLNTKAKKLFFWGTLIALFFAIIPNILINITYFIISRDFTINAKESADHLLGVNKYCIVAPQKKWEAAYFVKSFENIDLKEVIKQAVYFRLYIPLQEVGSGLASGRKRTYHFAIYNNEAMYYWSLLAGKFIKAPDYTHKAFQQRLQIYSIYKDNKDILRKGGFSQPSLDYYHCPY